MTSRARPTASPPPTTSSALLATAPRAWSTSCRQRHAGSAGDRRPPTRRRGRSRCVTDDGALAALGVRVVHADLAAGSDVFRHDPERLAACWCDWRAARPAARDVHPRGQARAGRASSRATSTAVGRSSRAAVRRRHLEIASGGEYAVRVSVALAAVARCLFALLQAVRRRARAAHREHAAEWPAATRWCSATTRDICSC